MTKFYNWVNENKDMKEQLVKDCQYYLKLLKAVGLPTAFFRGVNKSKVGKDQISLHSVRKDRKPKGTDIETFIEVNDFFEDQGHARRDKSIIATSNLSWTKIFGIPHMIFPVGKFNYTYVKTYDFNILKNSAKISKKLEWFLHGDLERDYDIEGALDELEKHIVTNRKIGDAYKEGYEIWFDCDKYYITKLSTMKKVGAIESAKSFTNILKDMV